MEETPPGARPQPQPQPAHASPPFPAAPFTPPPRTFSPVSPSPSPSPGHVPPAHLSTPPGPPVFSSPLRPAAVPFRASPVSPLPAPFATRASTGGLLLLPVGRHLHHHLPPDLLRAALPQRRRHAR
ncbi:hypothetical protein ACP70R_037513 [Stipagrostis hirtigluma subsp. patula]